MATDNGDEGVTAETEHRPDEAPPGHAIVRSASAVQLALDAVAESPAWSMTPAEQRDALLVLTQAQARLAELRMRVLAAADDADVGRDEAASSTAAWIAHACRQERARAHADVRLAHALDTSFDATRTALRDGPVNEAQARVIVDAVNALPETVIRDERRRAERHLIDLCGEWDAKHLQAFGRKLFAVIAPDEAERLEGEKLAEEEREAARKTYLDLRDNGDGTTTGRFKIPTLHGHMLTKALHALTSPRRAGKQGWVEPDGGRIPYPDILGRGLCELIERYPVTRLPKAGGLNASVVVTMTLEQLLHDIGTAQLDTGAEISPGQARRLACAAGVIPAVLGGDSQVLDVGRSSRLHTRSQRIALSIRDGGCTAENCDRPPGWCEVHHPVPWSRGGETSVDNGALLCAWHHHRSHDPAYETHRLATGKVRFRRRQ